MVRAVARAPGCCLPLAAAPVAAAAHRLLALSHRRLALLFAPAMQVMRCISSRRGAWIWRWLLMRWLAGQLVHQRRIWWRAWPVLMRLTVR